MMLVCRVEVVALILATFLMMSALHVHAEEPKGVRITVKGLVVSSGRGLTLNDGVQDYLLLGVDAPEYEGAICKATGLMRLVDEMPTIHVDAIVLITKEYPNEDLVGQRRGFGSPLSGEYRRNIRANVQEPPGVAMLSLYDLTLPIRDGSGMRIQKDADATCRRACRFQLFTPIRTA